MRKRRSGTLGRLEPGREAEEETEVGGGRVSTHSGFGRYESSDLRWAARKNWAFAENGHG